MAKQIAPSDAHAGLFNSAEFSDLIIRTSTREFHAHKAILCTTSDYFRAACTRGFEEGHTGTITLPEEYEVVESLLRYLYGLSVPLITRRGSLIKPKDAAVACLKLRIAADKYQLPNLVVKTGRATLDALDTLSSDCKELVKLGVWAYGQEVLTDANNDHVFNIENRVVVAEPVTATPTTSTRTPPFGGASTNSPFLGGSIFSNLGARKDSSCIGGTIRSESVHSSFGDSLFNNTSSGAGGGLLNNPASGTGGGLSLNSTFGARGGIFTSDSSAAGGGLFGDSFPGIGQSGSTSSGGGPFGSPSPSSSFFPNTGPSSFVFATPQTSTSSYGNSNTTMGTSVFHAEYDHETKIASIWQSISSQPLWQNLSFEEIRMHQDHSGRKSIHFSPRISAQGGLFGRAPTRSDQAATINNASILRSIANRTARGLCSFPHRDNDLRTRIFSNEKYAMDVMHALETAGSGDGRSKLDKAYKTLARG